MTAMTGQRDRHGDRYDVVVVGGGAAGLSGALTLGRSRRSVLVADAGEPRNAPAAGVHNYLGLEGVAPQTLLETGRREVRSYGGEVIDGRVESAVPSTDGFVVTLAGGRTVSAMHQIPLFSQWANDLTLFLHTAPAPSDDELEQLAALGVRVVAGVVESVVTTDGRLSGLRLADGTVVPRRAIVVAPRFVARADVLISLGLEVTENEVGTFVAGDAMGQTAAPGVCVAGNVADPRTQVIGAAAAALNAGAAINADLIREEVGPAVEAHRRQARLVSSPAV